MEITTKAKNYELLSKGKLGNTIKTWGSLAEFKESLYVGEVTIRYKGLSGGQFCYYSVSDVDSVVSEIEGKGGGKEKIVINESAPDEFLTVQGELMRNTHGLYFFYSTKQGKMRDCLKSASSVFGLRAKIILQHYLTPSSYEDVMDLLDEYPDHVIELSAYSKCLGSRTGRNALIWEVRKY